MAVLIRDARPADAAVWGALRARLWPDEDPAELAGEASAFFASGSPTVAAVLLALQDDEAVGFAELSLRPHVPGASSEPAPFLEAWYVEPHARGRGVGRALVEACERWALARGYTELGSDALLENEVAARAHEALGFEEVERLRSFLKQLTDD